MRSESQDLYTTRNRIASLRRELYQARDVNDHSAVRSILDELERAEADAAAGITFNALTRH